MDTNRFTVKSDEQLMVMAGFVRTYLTGLNKNEIIDIEQDFKDLNVRMFVDFYINLDNIGLKAVEIQDLKHGDALERDSKVLEWILQDEILPEYNKEYTEAYTQAKDIREYQQNNI